MNSEYTLDSIVHFIHRLGRMIESVVDETDRLFNTTDLDSRRKSWTNINDLVNSIEELRRNVIENILVYIVKTQPLGKDLLTSYVLLNIAYDVYRISRYCREIVRVDQILAPSSGVAELGLKELFEKAREAVKYAMKDLFSLKPESESIIKDIDEYVDNYYAESLKSILEKEITTSIKALRILIVRHIERIIDHTNYIEQYLNELT